MVNWKLGKLYVTAFTSMGQIAKQTLSSQQNLPFWLILTELWFMVVTPFKGTGQVKLMSAKIDAKQYPNIAADIFLILQWTKIKRRKKEIYDESGYPYHMLRHISSIASW